MQWSGKATWTFPNDEFSLCLIQHCLGIFVAGMKYYEKRKLMDKRLVSTYNPIGIYSIMVGKSRQEQKTSWSHTSTQEAETE